MSSKKGTTKYYSNKQEKEVAIDLKGRRVIASGALWIAKADVRSDSFLCECKTTEKPYYRLTALTWQKIAGQAVQDGIRFPLMCIETKHSRLGFIRFAVFDNNSLKLFNEDEIANVVLTSKTLSIGNTLDDLQKGVKGLNYKFVIGVYPPFSVTLVSWSDFIERAEEKGMI